MSRRGTPWLGPHAARAASSRGRVPGRRARQQQHSQRTGGEQRTCALCLNSTSAPNTKQAAPGCWGRLRVRNVGRGVFAQRRSMSIPGGSAPPLIRVCYYRVCYYYCYFSLQLHRASRSTELLGPRGVRGYTVSVRHAVSNHIFSQSPLSAVQRGAGRGEKSRGTRGGGKRDPRNTFVKYFASEHRGQFSSKVSKQ